MLYKNQLKICSTSPFSCSMRILIWRLNELDVLLVSTSDIIWLKALLILFIRSSILTSCSANSRLFTKLRFSQIVSSFFYNKYDVDIYLHFNWPKFRNWQNRLCSALNANFFCLSTTFIAITCDRLRFLQQLLEK